MAGVNFKQQKEVREWILAYIEDANQDESLRNCAAYIKEMAGYEVSPSTIARLLRDEGYEYNSEWQRVKGKA